MLFTQNKYLPIIKKVTKHLDSEGIKYELKLGDKVNKKELMEISKKIQLPKDLQDFYLEVGDGLYLRYETQSKDGVHPHFFIIMSLEYMLENKEGTLDSLEESLEESDSEKEKINLKRAINWIPFKDDLDGSYICSDPINNEIVHYRIYKNWETPITVIDKSFYNFFYNWSLYCFSDMYDQNNKTFTPFNSFISKYCDHENNKFKWSDKIFIKKLNRNKK